MKILFKISISLLLIFSLNSCLFSGVAGSRNVTTEKRNIKEEFTGIKVKQGIKVLLTQDENTEVEAEFDDNLHELLITEVEEDGVLHIYFSENVGKRKASTLRISMPQINSLSASSGGRVLSENIINTPELFCGASSGGRIKIEVNSSNLNVDASSGAFIELQGETASLSVNASSGADIDAENLEAQDADVQASSGANIEVQAIHSIDAGASSGGNIRYGGAPKEKKISKSSGGKIKEN